MGLGLCPVKGWTPAAKIAMKNLTGPIILLIIALVFLLIYTIMNTICRCKPKYQKGIKGFWYPRLVTAGIFSLLLFYQQIASTTFSLLYCVEANDVNVLFLDGTVACYQTWQVLVFMFAFMWVVPLVAVLTFLPGMLESVMCESESGFGFESGFKAF